MASPYAFVTLLTSDHYLPGALSLVAALRDVHPSPAISPEHEFQTVCIVTPETVDVSTIKLLRKAFDVVIGVELIVQNDQEGLKLLGRPDLNEVLTKLHVFRLTQYEKIIFLDADVLPIRPLSHLFTTPHEFSAVPDVGWPDIFNSGVLVLSPGEDKFSELQELLKSKGSWDGGDQGILNEWRGDNWNKLSFTYNTTPTAAYTYAPAYERFGKQISAIHFIGPNKPWKSIQHRAPFLSQKPAQNPSSQRAYDYDSLVDKWFDVYDRHYRVQSIIPEAPFEVQKYESVWNEHSQTSAPAPTGQGGALGLEELRRLAIQGIKSAGLAVENRSGDGEYQSFPLEGRVDLMRPQPPPAPRAPEVQYSSGPVTDNRPNEGEYKILSLSDHIDLMRPQPPPQRTLEVHASLQSSGHNSPGTPKLNEISSRPHPDPDPLPSPYYEHQEHHEHHGPLQQQQHTEQHSLHFIPPQEQPSVDSYHQSPPRPPSPPKLLWNPAIEPPPNIAPPLSAFPADTYFQNVWDQGPSKQHDRAHITSPTPDSGAFFHPPPPSKIPERIKDHYRNVTGESPSAEPNPDLNKVKPIFPWEDKPRSKPGRVFPTSDVPSPTWLTSPGEEYERPSSPELVTEVFSPPPPPKPPLPKGLPITLSYANAWDTVPSIQRYASRLVRSPPAPPPLPSFDDDDYRRGRKSWDERTEASSRDGDDEDNTDTDDGAPVVSRLADSDDDTSISGGTGHSWSRRGSLVSASYGIKTKKKEYRVRGVQTISPEMREQAVQVSILVDSPKVPITPKQEQKNTFSRPTRASSLSLQTGNSKKPHWTPPSAVLPPVVSREREGPPDLKITTGAAMGPSSGDDRNSRFPLPPDALSPSVPARSNSSTTVTPFSMNALSAQRGPTGSPQNFSPSPLGPSREPSNESMTSPSSTGPLSPPEGQPIGSIASPRRAGRVFDPARGVEVFKRGSEEVLARFLKMSSWEEDSSPQR
ncbi:hypothetical protein BDP27DRAFT_1213603 [Rhodocollybia butyracea]|uniref:glycogenin glucosyltransferase n=1 Tax=Rhodocollybia butyracea TaxID=206335 RepID=A0A9P5Q4U3_9AGAR|nr:hypothetical protein BDP27DRAFT_1213603 [Rhodocollybia butyracea]